MMDKIVWSCRCEPALCVGGKQGKKIGDITKKKKGASWEQKSEIWVAISMESSE
jgi:hypothetical protein